MMRIKSLVVLMVVGLCVSMSYGEERVIKLGIIGLDTSHVTAFTSYLNNPKNETSCKVVAAYPGGSDDVEASYKRLDKFTKQMKEKFGVEIVSSISELCERVDGILLESVDGRKHLEQVKPVFEAGLPVFIDKPMAGSFEDIVRIFHLAEKAGVRCWSSSSLRYTSSIAKAGQHGEKGNVLGCGAYSPCYLEEHHPDLYWYGIHGVEILYTIMGPGCEAVQRVDSEDVDLAAGKWKDGRIGTFRGMRKGARPYGAVVFGSKGVFQTGPYDGYDGLVREIASFFRTGEVPVNNEETIEIYAFMAAADISKQNNGAEVSVPELIEKTWAKVRGEDN